jgi:hypothetical protein
MSTSTSNPFPPPPSLPISFQSSTPTTELTPPSASLTTSSSSSSHILTQKVHHAISLNTTAPSFSSALDALATLQTPTQVDAKSIRTAIEQDALYHAKSLQEEMLRFVCVVKNMRWSIQNVVVLVILVWNEFMTNIFVNIVMVVDATNVIKLVY